MGIGVHLQFNTLMTHPVHSLEPLKDPYLLMFPIPHTHARVCVCVYTSHIILRLPYYIVCILHFPYCVWEVRLPYDISFRISFLSYRTTPFCLFVFREVLLVINVTFLTSPQSIRINRLIRLLSGISRGTKRHLYVTLVYKLHS